MKRKNYFKNYQQYKVFRKFFNLQKRIRGLMHDGEYYYLPGSIQTRLIRKLNLLYERIARIINRQTLKWATSAVALIISGTIASAQFNEPVNITGFRTSLNPSPYFVDYDKDGDDDIVIGNNEGNVALIENTNGKFEGVYGTESPFYDIAVDSLAAPAMSDVDNDDDLDLIIGSLDDSLVYYENIGGIYTLIKGVDNPFNGINVGFSSNPFFVDYDKDDDEDLIVGEATGSILYFRNDAGTFTELTGMDNPFDGIDTDFGAYPRMADYDNDGDLDLYVGNKYGELKYYKATGGNYALQTGSNNPFNSVELDTIATPFLINMDGDADWDLAVGDLNTRYLRYFSNEAGGYIEKRGTTNPFEGVLTDVAVSPAFADLDEDGDLDMVVSDLYGGAYYYENTGEDFIPVIGTDSPIDGILFEVGSKFDFEDWDGDGDPDMIVGDEMGKIRFFINDEGGFFEMTGDDNPFDAISLGNYITPVLIDLDNDNDQDLVIGKFVENGNDDYGAIDYYRNVNNNVFEQTGEDNPFSELFIVDTIFAPIDPAFADLDFDGDFDLYVGDKYGDKIETFINNDGVFSKAVGNENPFNGYDFAGIYSPTFADIENDGDLDLFVGMFDKYNGGQLYFVENTSGPSAVKDITASVNDIRVYSHDKIITIDPGELKIDRVEIFSVTGELVTSGILNTNGKVEVPVNNLNAGVYFVKTYSNGKIENHKVLVR